MQEMTDARISLPEHYIEKGDYRDESGFRAASRLVGLKESPNCIPKLVGALHASRLPCHKLAEGWGREEWGIATGFFWVSKNLGDAGHRFLA
jgi:hypothetical protein